MFESYAELGQLILLDDIKDLGKYSFEGHPSPIHHWQWGLLLILASELGDTLYSLYNVFGGDSNGQEAKS